MSDLQKDSVVMFQKKYYIPLSLIVSFLIPTLIYYFIVGTSFLGGWALSYTVYASILNATWCVNSICHMFGGRPYNQKIEPRDNFLVSLITMGEGYHNWHHEYPSDWKASKDDWWMINITTRLIEFGSLFNLTSVKSI
jgi:stearoyl-CoA desaturase (delta-9 desaturase)